VFRAPATADGPALVRLAGLYLACLRGAWGVTVTALGLEPAKAPRAGRRLGVPAGRLQACFIQGQDLDRLLPPAPSSVLAQRADGSTGLIAINRLPVQSEAEARARATQLARKVETVEAESFGPILHRLGADQALEDYRTGLSLPGSASDGDFRALWLSGLALPRELTAVLTAD